MQWAVNTPDDEDEDIANDEQRAAFIRKHRLVKELAKEAAPDTDFEALWRGLSESENTAAKAGRT